MLGWQANLKRTCALPVTSRVLPENEIPPVFTGGYLLLSVMSYESAIALVMRLAFAHRYEFGFAKCYGMIAHSTLTWRRPIITTRSVS